MGGMDIIRPLGLAGIRSWVVAGARKPMRYSRFVDGVIDAVDPWDEPDELAGRLIKFAQTQHQRPILYYENDGHLALVSRFRDQLSEHFRFVVPEATLVEALIDKARFHRLASALELPVPASCDLTPHSRIGDFPLDFPVVVKPLTRLDRDRRWVAIAGDAKAIRVNTIDELRRVSEQLRKTSISLLAQSLIAGAETSVESYHVYVHGDGEIVADFSGRKLRTFPTRYGHSTALTTAESPDVIEVGRSIARKLGLMGVAKLDFKRDASGSLHLLEVNPRFTLWNHLGALAGVNIPALVYARLTGGQGTRESIQRRRTITWCDVPKDFKAARADSVPLADWVRWVAKTDIKMDLAVDDPLPFFLGRLVWGIERALQRARTRVQGDPRS